MKKSGNYSFRSKFNDQNVYTKNLKFDHVMCVVANQEVGEKNYYGEENPRRNGFNIPSALNKVAKGAITHLTTG